MVRAFSFFSSVCVHPVSLGSNRPRVISGDGGGLCLTITITETCGGVLLLSQLRVDGALLPDLLVLFAVVAAGREEPRVRRVRRRRHDPAAAAAAAALQVAAAAAVGLVGRSEEDPATYGNETE